jgi:hypothetical protein
MKHPSLQRGVQESKKEKPAEKTFGFLPALGSAAYFSSPLGGVIYGLFSSPIRDPE